MDGHCVLTGAGRLLFISVSLGDWSVVCVCVCVCVCFLSHLALFPETLIRRELLRSQYFSGEREREREREREAGRQANKQRQTDRLAGRQANREIDRQTDYFPVAFD